MAQRQTQSAEQGKEPVVCTYGDCRELQTGEGEYCKEHQLKNREQAIRIIRDNHLLIFKNLTK